MDVSRIPAVSSSHDCGSLSRVVMVRKTDQRLINHRKQQGVNIILNLQTEHSNST